MANRRLERFIAYFNGPPLRGDRAKLMQKTGLSKGRVSQILSPDATFGEVSASRVAVALGLSPDYFEHDVPSAAAPGVPPPPPSNYQDRHEVTASDWGTLQDVKLVMTDAELAAVRERADRIRRVAQQQLVELARAARDSGQDE